jgi:hypothetical protein
MRRILRDQVGCRQSEGCVEVNSRRALNIVDGAARQSGPEFGSQIQALAGEQLSSGQEVGKATMAKV